MRVHTAWSELPQMHPNLLWEDIIAAAASVVPIPQREETCEFSVHVDSSISGLCGELSLLVQTRGVSARAISRVGQTYERARLVELSAIAVAGLAMY